MLLKHTEPVKENRVNCYICPNGHLTKTIDIDKGTTPFMFICIECGKDARSTFYRDAAPGQKPTIEWFRPDLKATIKLRRKPAMLDHVLQGGLDYRTVS